MSKAELENKNPISRGVGFASESWDELKKVTTPTRQETIQATMVVLVMLFLFATFLGLADFVVGKIMSSILL